MHITVEITGLDPLVAALRGLIQASLHVEAEAPKARKAPPAALLPAPAAVPTTVTPTLAVPTTGAPTLAVPTTVADAPAVAPFDHAKKLLLQVVRDKGRQVGADLLKAFEVERLSQVPADKLQALIDDASALLKV